MEPREAAPTLVENLRQVLQALGVPCNCNCQYEDGSHSLLAIPLEGPGLPNVEMKMTEEDGNKEMNQ